MRTDQADHGEWQVVNLRKLAEETGFTHRQLVHNIPRLFPTIEGGPGSFLEMKKSDVEVVKVAGKFCAAGFNAFQAMQFAIAWRATDNGIVDLGNGVTLRLEK